VAGRQLSPNAIEHGILRRSAFLAGIGYVRNPLPRRFERDLRVERPDPRVHFALNCGARSCPPLFTWSPETLDADLERATAAYLVSESSRSPDGTELRVPRLLRWYRGDFGGGPGIRALLRRHGVLAEGEAPRIRYADYDWTLRRRRMRADAPVSGRAGTAVALVAMTRPTQLLLVEVVAVLGIALARARGADIDPPAVAAGLAVLLPVAASIHLANEYADHETDARTVRTPFSGGSGALPRSGLDRSIALRAAQVTAAIGLGGALAAWGAGVLPGGARAAGGGAGGRLGVLGGAASPRVARAGRGGQRDPRRDAPAPLWRGDRRRCRGPWTRSWRSCP
jgi:hypothetical protein